MAIVKMRERSFLQCKRSDEEGTSVGALCDRSAGPRGRGVHLAGEVEVLAQDVIIYRST